MKAVHIVKIFFILSICPTSLRATIYESMHILDSLAPMRAQPLPSLTPRRPLRFCIGDSPSDMPQTRPPLNLTDHLELPVNDSTYPISRLGERPPLRLLNQQINQQTESLGFIENIQTERTFSPLNMGNSGGTTLSTPPFLPQQATEGANTLISPGAIPMGGSAKGAGSSLISPAIVPIGGGAKSGAEGAGEKIIGGTQLLAGKEAISKELPKIAEKTASQKIPKAKKTVPPKKHVNKKHMPKKTVKTKSPPKKETRKTSGGAIPRKTYLKDLQKKYNEGYLEGQKHPDCTICQLPEYLR